jgi:hypothetical protein
MVLLFSAAANAAVLPGYAGFPSPFNDTDSWYQDEGRLGLTASDTNWHYFVVPLPVKATGGSLNVSWRHVVLGGLIQGSAEVMVMPFTEDGTIFGNPSWNSSLGNPGLVGVNVPVGGSVILRVRMKADGGLANNHRIARVVTGGDAAL